MRSHAATRLKNYVLGVLICLVSSAIETSAAVAPQGPIGGAQIAVIQSVEGDVRVSRAATPNNVVRVTATGLGLASGDTVRTLQGKAEIRFNDNSIIALNLGTVVVVAERPTAGGVQRTIQQFLGSLWFNIEKVTGTETTLQTPTAVAAIRGTQGTQDVPNADQSTHALNEGLEQVTESLTQQSVMIQAGQSVTAIRGIGFTPVVALAALLARPVFTAGSGGGGGGVAGGGGGGAAGGAGGGAAGAASGAATGAAAATTASATTAVSSLASTITSVGVSAATSVVSNVAVPFAAQSSSSEKQNSNLPLNPPGGAISVIPGEKQGTSAFAAGIISPATEVDFTPGPVNYASLLRPKNKERLMTRFGGAVPLTAAGSMWALGALTHNQKVARTGELATRAVFAAEALAGGFKLVAAHNNRDKAAGPGDFRPTHAFASADAMRTFALASTLSREYRNKPLVVIGSYGFATAVSLSGIGPKRSPSQVLFGAIIGELIGRFVIRRNDENR